MTVIKDIFSAHNAESFRIVIDFDRFFDLIFLILLKLARYKYIIIHLTSMCQYHKGDL